MARRPPRFGLGLLYAGLRGEEAAQGVGAFDSAYTQSGPGPGVPEPASATSRWRPYLRGGQSVALTAATVRPGWPSSQGGAAVAYRLASESDPEDYRGWESHNIISDWTSPAAIWAAHDGGDDAIVVNPSSGQVVIISGHVSNIEARTARYQPRSDTWSAGYNWTSAQGLPTNRAMALDPEVDGRIILWAGTTGSGLGSIAYYSDDDGSSWTLYSVGFWAQAPASTANLSVAVAPGVDWLAVTNDETWYSDDRGLTWRLNEDASAEGILLQAVRFGDSYVVLYLRDSDSHLCVRVLANARSSFVDAEEIEVIGAACETGTITVDNDGRAYVYGNVTATDGIRCATSVDGRTWNSMRWGVWNETTPGWKFMFAASGGGSTYLLTHTIESTSALATTEDLHLFVLGGWSTVEHGPGAADDYNTVRERVAWGEYLGSADAEEIGVWAPFDAPEHGSTWTRSTGGGGATRDLTVEPGLELDTTGLQSELYTRAVATGYATNQGQIKLRIAASGPDLGTAAAPESQAHVSITMADGAYTYNAVIELGADGVRVRDGSTELDRLALDGTLPTQIRWHMTLGGISVWARQSGTKWQQVCHEETVSDGGATVTGDRITWGHSLAGTDATVSYWQFVGCSAGGSFHEGVDALGDLDLTTLDGVRGLAFGRTLPPGRSYPLPDASDISEGEDLGYLAAAGGPTFTGELVTLPVEYVHGVDKLYPDLSPSPSEYWEAEQGATAEVLVWDAGDDQERWRGGALLLVALRARLSTVAFRIDDGAGGWTTLGTLDLKLGDVTYALVGRTMVPVTGSAAVARYINEGELAGGWVRIRVGGVLMHRRIATNSAGYWTTASGVQKLRITLEGIDGTEDATGTGSIFHHSGVLVVYPSGDLPRRALSVQIGSLGLDASDTTPYRAGLLAPGRIVGVGATPGWDWERRLEVPMQVDRGADGSPRVTRLGPTRQVWSYGWQAGVMLQELRLEADPGDWVGLSSGVPIGTEQDAWQLWHYVDHLLEGGEIPCVALPYLPQTSGTTITDPTLYLYGVAIADSYVVSGVVGNEGTNEVIRPDGITIEQIP